MRVFLQDSLGFSTLRGLRSTLCGSDLFLLRLVTITTLTLPVLLHLLTLSDLLFAFNY